MKHKALKLLSFLPALLLSGCGYGLKEIYKGDVYNSVDYYKNFYQEWDNDLNYHKETSKISNKEAAPYILDKEKDSIFTSYNDDNFKKVESEADKYSYASDMNDPISSDKKSYGQTFALGNNDETFKYGYISKLFNGQMFCNGSYELARVQIDENGFAVKFKKEIRDYSYFALNFKASLDYRRDGKSTNLPTHLSSINLLINFYLKEDNNTYRRVPVSYQINNIITNGPELMGGINYIFFGFSLKNINISRLCGFSVEYDLLSDEYKDLPEQADKGWTHCLLLYEMFLPKSTWH